MRWVGKFCLGLSVFLALTACTGQRDFDFSSPPVVIRDDGGGQLISAEADRLKLLQRGVEVEVRGYCASACVIFTTLPNACLGKKARIGFHGSNVSVPFLIGDAQMSRYLRGEAQRMYIKEWSKIPQTVMHWLTPQEYQKLDPQIKICK